MATLFLCFKVAGPKEAETLAPSLLLSRGGSTGRGFMTVRLGIEEVVGVEEHLEHFEARESMANKDLRRQLMGGEVDESTHLHLGSDGVKQNRARQPAAATYVAFRPPALVLGNVQSSGEPP
nr:hypothetical protein Iba_chr04cCG6010 [Ipomoea batatas]